MSNSISVVLPNYNGRDLIESFLPFTFEALTKTRLPYEVILIDDASKDNSVNWVKENYPEIKILQNPTNRGFSFTCNRGIFEASMDLVLLLNTDIKLDPEYLCRLISYFEHGDTFGVMGKIINPTTSQLEIGAKLPKKRGFLLKAKQNFLPEETDSVQPLPTFFLSGANALIDRKKLQALGGLDEVFSPYYSEDLDLSVRAWRRGWKCFFEPKAQCFHLGSASIKTQSAKSKIKKIYFRNRMIFHAIHLEPHQLKGWKVQTLLTEVLPKFLMGKIWIWRSYREMLALWPDILLSRRRINSPDPILKSAKSLKEIHREILSLVPKSTLIQPQ
ncbi:glycosyltransferase family 2 protein [Algoriphagus sp.]|uniref:glycosyltransferase family 2 protein n=1 Tax=Algoriphagus sp. TaxID=1872435 RepID=UPI00260402AF|nr:glycosyltransferase family 2 protein [Algoriphagus sp.]